MLNHTTIKRLSLSTLISAMGLCPSQAMEAAKDDWRAPYKEWLASIKGREEPAESTQQWLTLSVTNKTELEKACNQLRKIGESSQKDICLKILDIPTIDLWQIIFNTLPLDVISSLDIDGHRLGGYAYYIPIEKKPRPWYLEIFSNPSSLPYDDKHYINYMGIMADKLASNTTITYLKMTDNSNGWHNSSDAMCKMLAENHALKTLDLSGLRIRHCEYHLWQGLGQNNSLTSLTLRGTSIKITAEMLKGLSQNVTLTQIDLGYNDIDVEGAKYIGKMLSVNHTLQKLNLNNNIMGLRGVKVLSEGLKKNRTLTHLNVEHNGVQDKDRESLPALVKNACPELELIL